MPLPEGFGVLHFPYTGPGLAGTAENTMGFRYTVPPTPTDLDDIATVWAAYCNLMASSWAGGQLEAQLGTAAGDQQEFSNGSGGAGNLTGALPNNVSVLLRKSTGLGGRANRGRCFLPPPPGVSMSTENRLAQTAADAIATAWVDIKGSMESNGLNPVLIHRASETSTDITALSVPTLVATLRGRLRD